MSKKGVITIGKWCFKFGIVPDYNRIRGYLFHFGIFKVISRPLEGEVITKKNYKGFWLRKYFDWKGFEIKF